MNEVDLVLKALRRLKGSSNRKEKMSTKTKIVFDQLTEDAMKLMEDDVYDEKQEVFQREADGFESLARARGEGTSSSLGNKQPNSSGMSDSSLNGIPSAYNSTNNEDDSFDTFAEDDDKSTVDPSAGIGSTENDCVFDESSSYYYSNSLGYYYDPSSGLYCSATSGQCSWEPIGDIAERFHALCLKDSGVLYEDHYVQVEQIYTRKRCETNVIRRNGKSVQHFEINGLSWIESTCREIVNFSK
uniref:OCRE domain-containing protein n=1 Tax=Lactuca sativa TaxID=4236 RepID=A0A9R1XTP4_LACSA|nr:hypothetical protein LSAT_V11C200094540 [Lactuca sativa]